MTDAEAEPAWLAAWRERQSQPQPALAPAAAKRTNRPVPPERPKANWHGFIEPERWTYDGGVRREPVLDTDCHPPRVVRKMGWRNCMACGKPFFSEDVLALRLCDGPEGCRDQKPRTRNSKAATIKETGQPA